MTVTLLTMARSTGWNGRFGAAAESYAARWLTSRGLTIEATRYRCPEGELDIVARDRGTLVIVEVKARSSHRFGVGGEAVDRKKRRRIRAATRRYLWERDLLGGRVRFDVLSLDSRAGRISVAWTRNAFGD